MPKSNGLPIDIGGKRAEELLGSILFSLDNDFLESGALGRKYVLPVISQHGFSEPKDWRRMSEFIRPWFKNLEEDAKVKLLREIVRHLVTRADEFTKKLVLKTLRRRHVAFLQGSFFDSAIKGSEYRTVFHVYQPEKTPVGEGGNGRSSRFAATTTNSSH